MSCKFPDDDKADKRKINDTASERNHLKLDTENVSRKIEEQKNDFHKNNKMSKYFVTANFPFFVIQRRFINFYLSSRLRVKQHAATI